MNKLTKLLSVFVIACALGVGMAGGAVGCKGGGNSGGGGGEEEGVHHTDSHELKYESKNANKHTITCTVDGCDYEATEGDHTYDGDSDATCNDGCGYVREVNAQETATAITPVYKGPAAALVSGATLSNNYVVNASELDISEVSDNGYSDGVFSLAKGATVRTRGRNDVVVSELTGDNVGTKADAGTKFTQSIKNSPITINAAAAGKLTVWYSDGSSGDSRTNISLTGGGVNLSLTTTHKCDGVVIKKEINIPAAGTYTLSNSGGTLDVYKMSFEFESEVKPIKSVKIATAGTTDYLISQKVDCTGVVLKAEHDDGVVTDIDLENVEFDVSEYDPAATGEYQITATYRLAGNLSSEKTEFTATYNVSVYAVDSIVLHTKTTVNEKQSTLKQGYMVGDTFSAANLTVWAKCKLGEKTVDFRLKDSMYTAAPVDTSTAGKKDFTVSINTAYTVDNKEVKETIPVVVKAEATATNEKITVTVGADKDFQTLTQAMGYLESYSAKHDVYDKTNKVWTSFVNKEVQIDDGEYYEKIYIDVPGVHLVGSATNEIGASDLDSNGVATNEHNNGVVLYYDGVSGKTDAVNVAYGTKGSSSVTISTNAAGFRADNITFKNASNTYALYNADKNNASLSGNTQAVALMVESPSAEFYNCKVTGYHDTLYVNKGNSFFGNCWIEGHTDFIFGGDADVYFYKSTIYTIGDNSETNGGYVVASQCDEEWYVFNECEFKADSNTVAGTTSLGRPWASTMKMIVMNSVLDGHISTTANNTTKGSYLAQGARYSAWKGDTNPPSGATLYEYNNTGDSAISESLADTCTVVSATQAANYDIFHVATVLDFMPEEVAYVTVHSTALAGGQVKLGFLKGDTLSENDVKGLFNLETYNWVGAYVSDATGADSYAFGEVAGNADIYVKVTAAVDMKTITVKSTDETPTTLASIEFAENAAPSKADIIKAVTAPSGYKVAEVYSVYTAETKTVYDPANVTFADFDVYVTFAPDLPSSVSLAGVTVNTTTLEDVYGGWTYVGKGINWNMKDGTSDAVQLKAGDKLIFSVAGKVEFTWYGGNYGNPSQAIITYDNEGKCTVEVKAGYNPYIKSFTIDYDTIPAASTDITVNFSENYGEEPTVTPATVKSGNYADAPATAPTRTGYKFLGWYADADGTTAFDFTNTKIDAITTIYAKWELNTPDMDAGTNLTFGSNGNYKSYAEKYTAVGTLTDSTSGTALAAGATLTIKGKAGTIITINATATYKVYIGDSEEAETVSVTSKDIVVTADGTIKIEAVSETTITSISAINVLGNGYSFAATSVGKVVGETVTAVTSDMIITNFFFHNNTYLLSKTNNVLKMYVKGGTTVTIDIQYSKQAFNVKVGGNALTADDISTTGAANSGAYTMSFTVANDGWVELTGEAGKDYIKTISIATT